MRITTLGELALDGRPVRGERLAAVVLALVDARGRTVTPAALAEAVWGGAPPEDAAGAVHALIARARKLGLPVAAVPGGYKVAAGDVEPDTVLARARLEAARRDRDPAAAAEARELFPKSPDLGDDATATLFADVTAARAETGAGIEDLEADLRALVERVPPHEPSAALLMRLLAAGGRPAEALAVAERLRETLAEQYGTDPSPVVADAHLAVLRGELTPEPSKPRRRKPLPAAWRRATTAMLGRDRDLATIQRALAEGPLVTVVAVGGAGKTRIAAEVARRAADTGTSVHVVELAGVRTDAEVLPAVLAVTDPALGAELPTTAERLAELSGLLVLDNCEHVLAGAAQAVAEVLEAAPDVAVLATSRAPLGVYGELVHRLPTLDDDAAVDLLTTRTQAGGAVLSGEPAILRELCGRLDNLPLALELAAARLRHMPIEDVLAGLDDRFGLLDDALRGLPDRHASLWAMVDWSRELLGPRERELLERLAVIPAPFTRDVAAAVSGQAAAGLAVRLAALVEQSLLVLEDGHRYRMLETVREYGEARLAASGGRDAAMDGLVAWARDEAVRLHGAFIGPGQLAAFARCGAEQDNLVAALRRATGRDDAAAVDIAVPLFHLWTVRGLHAEATPWTAALLHADDPVARREGRLVHAADPDRLTWLCLLAGINAFAVDAHRVFVVAKRTLARIGAAGLGGRVSPRAAALAIMLPTLGRDDMDATLAAAEALIAEPDPYAQGFGLFLRGVIKENRGEILMPDERTADAERAHRAFEAAGDHWGMGMAAQMIGSQGGPDSAEWLRRGAGHMELLGAADDAGSIRVLLDAQLAQGGDDAAAERLAEVARAQPPTPGTGMQVMDPAQANLGLAQYAWMRGRAEDAVGYAERAAALADAIDLPVPQARVAFNVAAAAFTLRARGRAGAAHAARYLDGTHADALNNQDVPSMGVWALGAAALAAHLGDADGARELWALGLRCSAYPAQLFEVGGDAVLDRALGRTPEAPLGPEPGEWRKRPMTEVNDRIRALSGGHLQTLRR
ncbi:BTAD domain-containing putative transcriptional regulator [Dactylosporangium sp. CS-047395]|uniref:BTAD domain-containing putative transcriptional regulator n=1 Tax=Dactylosporangium sp. CS-047395 TaxID=3239936 RepID=UPI003D89E21E